MSFEVEQLDRSVVIKITETKLNSLVSPELKSQLSDLSNSGTKNIILDLSLCTYCDSSGLSAILIGNRLCQGLNGAFVLCGLNDTIQKLIELSRLDSIIKITPTVSEAHDLILLDEIEKDFNQSDK